MSFWGWRRAKRWIFVRRVGSTVSRCGHNTHVTPRLYKNERFCAITRNLSWYKALFPVKVWPEMQCLLESWFVTTRQWSHMMSVSLQGFYTSKKIHQNDNTENFRNKLPHLHLTKRATLFTCDARMYIWCKTMWRVYSDLAVLIFLVSTAQSSSES